MKVSFKNAFLMFYLNMIIGAVTRSRLKVSIPMRIFLQGIK